MSTYRTGLDWIKTEANLAGSGLKPIWPDQDWIELQLFSKLANQDWIGLRKFLLF